MGELHTPSSIDIGVVSGLTPLVPSYQEVTVGGVRGYKLDSASEGHLIHTSLVGNNEFPQSYLAQGIRLAEAMVDLIQQGMDVRAILDAHVDLDKMDEQKIRAHKAHGFETIPLPHFGVFHVWVASDVHAKNFLFALGKRVFPGAIPENMGRDESITYMFEGGNSKFVADMKRYLEVARKALREDNITAIGEAYRGEVEEFMRKYPPLKPGESLPVNFSIKQYRKKQEELMAYLRKEINGVAQQVQNAVMEVLPPDLRSITEVSPEYFFGGRFEVGRIDPLRLTRESIAEDEARRARELV